MNLPFRPHVLRCLALVALCLAATPAHSQITTYMGTRYYPTNTEAAMLVSGYVNVRVAPERAMDNFTLYYKKPNDSTTYSRSLTPMGLGGNGFGPTATVTCLALSATPPTYPLSNLPLTEYWVYDSSTLEYATHTFAETGQTTTIPAVIDLRGTTWTYTGSGAPPRSFALAVNDHWGHSLIAGTPTASWVTVTAGLKIGTFQNGSSGTMVQFSTPWYLATATPAGSFYLADLNTDNKAPTGTTDARSTSVSWSYDPQYSFYPFYNATVTLNSGESGHKFTVHCKVGSAPEMQISATAGASSISFAVPSNVPFWVTRDAENFTSPRPVAPSATTTWTAAANNQTFSAASPTNVFPQPPSRILTAHKFRINMPNRQNHSFTVRMSDGYTTAFTGIPDLITEQIDNWHDDGSPAPLPLYCFTAMIDPNFNVTLVDETTGATLLTADPTVPSEDILDGWTPAHGSAPQYPHLTLILPASRIGHTLSLLNGATEAEELSVPGDSVATQHYDGVDDMAGYDLDFVEFMLNSPLPYLNTFTLADQAGLTGDLSPTLSAAINNDLRTWLLPPVNRPLQISTSRWNHALIVRHPNADTNYPHGESHAINQHEQSGDTTLIDNHYPWHESYYYFEADGDVRGELPWYVEDTTTHERIGPLAGDTDTINAALNNWFYTPAPAWLTATEDTQGRVNLQWPLSAASRDGAYSIEVDAGDGWNVYGDPLPADQANASTDVVTFQHQAPGFPPQIQYRVRFVYGDQFSPYSPVATFHWLDANGNGLPDALEFAASSLDASVPVDWARDSDGDGIPDMEETLNGSDPLDYYNGQAPHLVVLDGPTEDSLPNRRLNTPLRIQVTDSNHNPMLGAPVKIAAGLGGGRIASSEWSLRLRTSVTQFTDSDGIAVFSLEAPCSPGSQSFVITAGSSQSQFAINVNYGLGPPGPTEVAAQPLGYGTALSWVATNQPAVHFEIERSLDGVIWEIIGTAPADARSYTDNYVSVSDVVLYRVSTISDNE